MEEVTQTSERWHAHADATGAKHPPKTSVALPTSSDMVTSENKQIGVYLNDMEIRGTARRFGRFSAS